MSFSYEPERVVLSEINLTIPFGETLAIVGRNGCGKSTLLNLLPRFFDPDQGAVTIDGQDIRTANLRSLRRQIALVTQETVLFDDTIARNIAYGRRRAGRELIEEAARKAFAHEFIEKLPRGYETRVGELARSLSGGERQRIALARAILRNPSILLLDEFSSQIDAESEAKIHLALRVCQGPDHHLDHAPATHAGDCGSDRGPGRWANRSGGQTCGAVSQVRSLSRSTRAHRERRAA